MFTVVVRPHKKGKFQAWIEGEEDEVFVSDTPFCHGARRLLRRGEDPAETLTMKYAGHPTTISLQGCIGSAASLTVHEKRTVRFVPWRAFPDAAVSASIAEIADRDATVRSTGV